MNSLLAVFAHPDDESIACGALLARCADEGVRVCVLCVTRGEDAHPSDGDRAALAVRRTKELEAAGEILGISDLLLLDYPDGELEWLDEERGHLLERDIASAIARIGANVVITFDEDGLYWHPDHIAVHVRTTNAVARLGPTAPALFYVTVPEGAMRALADTAGGHILGIDDPDAFGALAPRPTLVVDGTRYAHRKLRALKCHESQIAGGAFERVNEGDAARILSVEQFRRAPVGATSSAFIEAFAR